MSVLEGYCEEPEVFKYDFPARENWSIPLAEGPISILRPTSTSEQRHALASFSPVTHLLHLCPHPPAPSFTLRHLHAVNAFPPQGGNLWASSCVFNALKASHSPRVGAWRRTAPSCAAEMAPIVAFTHLLALRDVHWSS